MRDGCGAGQTGTRGGDGGVIAVSGQEQPRLPGKEGV